VRAIAFLVGLPFLAERFDELAVLIENDDRVLGVGVEIDAILRIDLNRAVSAAELHAFRQIPPASNPFVAVIAGAENDRVRSGVGRKE
jgi:mitochondrial fission protein ELM1